MIIFYIFAAFCIIRIILNNPRVKGSMGEAKIKQIIGRPCDVPGREKFVIHNLMLENNSHTTQIDHVVINQNGVFVIETKNYSGTIYGNDNQREWTQVFSYGREKYHFYNPVKQNAGHVHSVRKLIGDGIPVHSLVVFTKGNTSTIDSDYVYTPEGFSEKLHQGSSQKLTPKEMTNAYKTLLAADKKDTISNAEHVKNIRNTQIDIANGICPRCHSKLVIRHEKNGDFVGCSNYPKCRFTKPLG